MRIRIIQQPTTASIDGIRLDRFERGALYDVGTNLGSLMLAEGWAVPAPADDPALLIPLHDAHLAPTPSNLIIETRRSLSADRHSQAADRPPRRRRRAGGHV